MCTALQTPLTRALSGLIILQVAAENGTDSEVAAAHSQAMDRLNALSDIATRYHDDTATPTLRRNLGNLAVAANRIVSRLSGISPENRTKMMLEASATGQLESAANSLAPTCGKYWG